MWLLRRVYVLLIVLSTLCISTISSAAEVDPRVIETLVYEARGEGLTGMIAVAEIIRTRAREQHKTYTQVIMAPYQFSCWNKAINKNLRHPSQDEYQVSRQAWEESEGTSITRGANHYLNPKHVSKQPSWANSKTFVVKIGQHAFHRVNRA